MSMSSRATQTFMAGAAGLAAIAMVPASAQLPMERMSESQMRAMMSGWPASAQKAAADMIMKYGAPQEVTPTMLKWRNNGPWKYTRISNYETPHCFPAPHPDVMEQAINYRVPVAMFDDLAAYDGSVTVDRSQGHLAARCDMEGANFLAINLAHDVATRRKGVVAARAIMPGRSARSRPRGGWTPICSGCSSRRRAARTTPTCLPACNWRRGAGSVFADHRADGGDPFNLLVTGVVELIAENIGVELAVV